jgi:mannose/fructose/N-acetylgalactosamine-specific phosphotransferase system component IIC
MPMFDSHMILTIVGIALVGGFIGLDRTAAGQFMISQPVVVGPLTGWLLGDPGAGIITGVVLELIWVLDMPIGSFVPADATISTVSATAIAALGSPAGSSLPIIGFSILLTAVMAPATMMADDIVRHWNSRLADALVIGPGTGMDPRHALVRAHLSGLPVFFLKSFVLYLVFLPAGVAAVSTLQYMPEHVHRALSLFVKLLPLVGAALVVRKLSTRTVDLFFLSGFVIAALAGMLFHAPALVIILLTVAGGWLGGRQREQRS